MENQQEVDDGGMKALKGKFDNLVAATVTEKSAIQQLVLNNTKLAASNKSLVALVKKLTGTSRTLNDTTRASRKAGKSAAGVQPSATTARKKSTTIQTHATSFLKTNTSAPLVVEACCDGVGRSAYIVN